MKLTDEQWQETWNDTISSGVLSKCRKCGRQKKLLYRDSYTVTGLTATSPVWRCVACEPEGETT